MTAPTRAPGHVLIAGVPWPIHKVISLTAGLIAIVVVVAATGSVGPAVVAGWAVCTVSWLLMGLLRTSDR